MTGISLIQYARLLGSNTVIGMAEKVGLTPPPPPISVSNLINLAGRIIKPFAPVGLQPQNGAQGISNDPYLFWQDPGEGTPAAAFNFYFIVAQNNVEVGSPPLTGWGKTSVPLTPPGAKWAFPLPPGEVTLTVLGSNRAGDGPASTSTFTVGSPPPPPPPSQPTITASIGSDDTVTVSGKGFNKSQTVNFQVTVRSGLGTPNLAPNNVPDARTYQFAQTSADGSGSFPNFSLPLKNFFQPVQFEDGETARVLAGEMIWIIAKNSNVESYSPGPGVSNIVTLKAPSKV